MGFKRLDVVTIPPQIPLVLPQIFSIFLQVFAFRNNLTPISVEIAFVLHDVPMVLGQVPAVFTHILPEGGRFLMVPFLAFLP